MGKMKYDRKNVKKWARENYRGLENVLLPTFTKDLAGIDENGIRLDVRQTIKHGFTKTLIASDCGTTISELKRVIETVIDEAQGKIHTSLYLAFDNRKTQLEMLKFGQEAGIDNVLLHYPASETFNSEDDVYNYTKMISESSDIAINLYGSHKYNFGRFHPSMFSPKLVARMAQLETVAGYKEGIIDFTHFAEVFELCGDQLLPMSPVEGFHAVFIEKYGMQWAGGFPWEFYQDAESQQMVKNFQTMTEGRFKDATEVYWRLAPIRYYLFGSISKQVELGMYNYNQWKYAQWLVGGAGGHVRQPCMKLYDHEKEALKFAMRFSGVKIREDAYHG